MSVCSSNKPLKMATLHKFKLLTLHCGAAQSPTRSPRTSPLIQLRRRKPSLLMLLSRSRSRRSHRRRESTAPVEPRPEKRNSLKELFGSSPPFEGFEKMEKREEFGLVVVGKEGGGGVGPGAPRPGWTGFRYRSLLRRAWRPVLVTIPE
ncbi:uncharacterized protein LOC126791806 [Argentina anserina]|uniref:uncharacterized protein LOC126791806 n=1 Tax=Argentina anserina TaxID=57926 RepID=UPI0021765D43|nr:uncharacterized protein LOC126791806 [Potentilla anserina]